MCSWICVCVWHCVGVSGNDNNQIRESHHLEFFLATFCVLKLGLPLKPQHISCSWELWSLFSLVKCWLLWFLQKTPGSSVSVIKLKLGIFVKKKSKVTWENVWTCKHLRHIMGQMSERPSQSFWAIFFPALAVDNCSLRPDGKPIVLSMKTRDAHSIC